MLQKNTTGISAVKKITASFILCFIVKICFAQVSGITDSISSQVFRQQQQLLQQNDYSITGKVTDEAGRPVKMANVFTLNNSFLAFTDNDGNFSFKLKYPDVKEYTNLSFTAVGKQAEIRNIHIASFPAVVNVKMEPIKQCCIIKDTSKCCAIDVSWTVDRLFEEDKPVKKAKSVKPGRQ